MNQSAIPLTNSLKNMAITTFSSSAAQVLSSTDLNKLNPYQQYPELFAIQTQVMAQIETNDNTRPTSSYHFHCAGYLASKALGYYQSTTIYTPSALNLELAKKIAECNKTPSETDPTKASSVLTSLYSFHDASVQAFFAPTIDVKQSYVFAQHEEKDGCADWVLGLDGGYCNEDRYKTVDDYTNFSFNRASFSSAQDQTGKYNFLNDVYDRRHIPTSVTDSTNPLLNNIRNQTLYYPPFETYLQEMKYKVCAENMITGKVTGCTTDKRKIISEPIDLCGEKVVIYFFEGFSPGIMEVLKFTPPLREEMDALCGKVPKPNFIYAQSGQTMRDLPSLDSVPDDIKIIFIGHSWGAHNAIQATYETGGRLPNLIITLDPVVHLYAPSNLDKILALYDSKLSKVFGELFSATLALFRDAFNYLDRVAPGNFSKSSNFEEPFRYNWWYNVRATIENSDADKSPFSWDIHKLKVCVFGKCWVVATWPENIRSNSWDPSDFVAYWGGKYYDWPNGKADTHRKDHHHHKNACSMLKLALDDLQRIGYIQAGYSGTNCD